MSAIFVNLLDDNQNVNSTGESCYGNCNCNQCYGCYCDRCYTSCYDCYTECGSNSYC